MARNDDLGLFIAASLNIYFSAQGEAEKKNVSLQVSISAGLSTISPPPPVTPPPSLTFTRQASCDGTRGIMGDEALVDCQCI